MHEIITIQIGSQANALATHFWNAQESYFVYDPRDPPAALDHDVHFRPGVNTKGEETYTPRTLIYDLKTNFGGLRKWGGLYDQQLSVDEGIKHDNGKLWSGHMAMQKEPEISPNEYQQALELDDPHPPRLTNETVRFWSDFNRVFYHPRSIIKINEHGINNTLQPLETFDNGESLFTELQQESDMLDDHLRPWAEEADQMQGFQMLCGNDNAWAGFCSQYGQILRDEYPKNQIWVWGIEQERHLEDNRARKTLRTLNQARLVSEIVNFASMYMPMSIPDRFPPDYVELDSTKLWQTSALLSSAYESITLPSRIRPDHGKRLSLDNMETLLNVNGNQRIAQLQLAKGNSLTSSASSHMRQTKLRSLEHSSDLDLDLDLSGFANLRNEAMSTSRSFGGFKCTRVEGVSNTTDQGSDDQNPAIRGDRPVVEDLSYPLGYPIPSSFPPIFKNVEDEKIPLQSSLSTSSEISGLVSTYRRNAAHYAPLEYREELSNSLHEIASAYIDGWESDEGNYSDE